jgi:hypothetical protein
LRSVDLAPGTDDVICERRDQADDLGGRLGRDSGCAERRDEMADYRMEVLLTYAAPPVHIPNGRSGVGVRTTECRREELDLPSLQLFILIPAKNPASSGSLVTR